MLLYIRHALTSPPPPHTHFTYAILPGIITESLTNHPLFRPVTVLRGRGCLQPVVRGLLLQGVVGPERGWRHLRGRRDEAKDPVDGLETVGWKLKLLEARVNVI